MLLSSGLRTAPCGAPVARGPFLQSVQDVRLQERFDQRQHGAVGDLFLQARHQTVVRDRVEVALQVGVHHVDVARLEQLIDPTQGVFAAASRTKPVAVFREVALEDRLDHVHHRRLHHAIAHRGNAQRSRLVRARLGDVNASNRLRLIRAVPQLIREFPERFRKPLARIDRTVT